MRDHELALKILLSIVECVAMTQYCIPNRLARGSLQRNDYPRR